MSAPRKIFPICVLIGAFLLVDQPVFANYSNPPASQIALAGKFYLTELYFGMNIAGGGKVSDEDWDKFLETEVTPRFPDGFTAQEGFGQFKDSTGRIVREASRILILFYPKKERKTIDPKIEELRAIYKKRFNQESVMRLDFTKPVELSF